MTFTACVLAALGCRSEDKPKPPPAPVDGIEVISQGAEPRRVLRYALASTVTPLELAMDVELQTVDAAVKMPTIAMSIDIGAATVAQDSASMKMTVVAAGARPRDDKQDAEIVKLVDRQSSLLGGLVIGYALSPTGEVSNSKVETVGRDLSGPLQEQIAQLLQLVDKLAMGLPDKPIGVGAIWKHRRTIAANQLKLLALTTVEVTAIEGDRISFKSTSEMTGADQTITQGSASADVKQIRGSGSQSGSFDLATGITLGETRATLGFEMTADGQKRPTKFEMITRLGPRTPTSPAPPSDAGP